MHINILYFLCCLKINYYTAEDERILFESFCLLMIIYTVQCLMSQPIRWYDLPIKTFVLIFFYFFFLFFYYSFRYFV